MTCHPIPGDRSDPLCYGGTFTDVAMSLRMGRRRAFRDIARELADSDPRLDELFLSFNQRASGGKMPRAEKIRTRPLRLITRPGRREHPASDDFQGPAAWWR